VQALSACTPRRASNGVQRSCTPYRLAVLLLLGSWYVMEVSPVSPHKMALVYPGMDEHQVRQLLGDPAGVEQDSVTVTWTYSRSYLWQMVYVEFHEGKVADIRVDR